MRFIVITVVVIVTKQRINVHGPLANCVLDCQQKYCRGAWVRLSSVRAAVIGVSQKPLPGSRPNFMASHLSAISLDRFFSANFSIFFFFFFFANLFSFRFC